MLYYQTALIVGAGASVPYEFPTGVQLCAGICQHLDSIAQGHKFDQLFPYDRERFQRFHTELFYSGMNSPDQFLENRPDFLEVGKLAIAAILMQRERADFLFSYKTDNWLRALYARINASQKQLMSGKISIITFNYDRCIEYFLHTAIRNTYSIFDEQAARILESIPIVHLHGQLGYLPWERKPPELTRPFDIDMSEKNVTAAMKGIKIIHEDTNDRDEDFQRAHEILRDAERIVFLGFGYNRVNLDRLQLPKLQDKQIFGTSIGLGRQQADYVKKYLAQGGTVTLDDQDCAFFIREYIE